MYMFIYASIWKPHEFINMNSLFLFPDSILITQDTETNLNLTQKLLALFLIHIFVRELKLIFYFRK